MAEGRDSGGHRTVLGDLTNRIGKRELFNGLKNEITTTVSDDRDDVVKRVRVSPFPSTDASDMKGNIVSFDESRAPNLFNFGNSIDMDAGEAKAREGNNNNDRTLGLEEYAVVDEDKRLSLVNPVAKINIEPKITSCGEENDPSVFDLIVTRGSGDDCFLGDGNNFEENVSVEGSQSNYHNDVDDNYMLSQSGSIDCTMQSDSVKEEECSHTSGKDCWCSFCRKAAYMLLDLNYQDIKARLSVMKKSQKDASMLAVRSSRINFSEKNGSESSTRASKMESHLMYNWRSLFQRTSEIWKREANQLEARLLPLTEQREKCKTELESKMAEKL